MIEWYKDWYFCLSLQTMTWQGIWNRSGHMCYSGTCDMWHLFLKCIGLDRDPYMTPQELFRGISKENITHKSSRDSNISSCLQFLLFYLFYSLWSTCPWPPSYRNISCLVTFLNSFGISCVIVCQIIKNAIYILWNPKSYLVLWVQTIRERGVLVFCIWGCIHSSVHAVAVYTWECVRFMWKSSELIGIFCGLGISFLWVTVWNDYYPTLPCYYHNNPFTCWYGSKPIPPPLPPTQKGVV